jgi:hypothetical protein
MWFRLAFFQLADMIHFGLKIIDEHGAKCSDLLRDVASARAFIEESVDHMRSQWLFFSISKQEEQALKGVFTSFFYKWYHSNKWQKLILFSISKTC